MARIADSKKPATKGSLMKQTKAELVNIILRKDSVEREKQEIIDELHKKAVTRVEYDSLKDNYLSSLNKVKDAEKKLFELKANYEKLDIRNSELSKTNNDLKEALDEDASVLQETRNKYKFWRDFAVAYVLITIIIVVLKAIM